MMNITPRAAAGFSIASNTVLVAAKLAVGLVTGSVSVVSEAVHSGMDLIAAAIAFFSVTVSARPPDQDHHFGHGKVENVSGVIEAALILAAAVLIVFEAVRRLVGGGEVERLGLGLLVMGVSAALNLVVSRVLFATAKKHDSIALEADAHHLSTDVLTSVGVFAGLALVQITDIHAIDAIVAIAVAALIAWLGWDVLRRSFADILDGKLPDQVERRIRLIIEDHRTLYVNYHKMRTRKSGPEKHLDLHLVVCRSETVRTAHDLSEHIEREIREKIGRIQVTTHIEPCPEPEARCDECDLLPAGGPRGRRPREY